MNYRILTKTVAARVCVPGHGTAIHPRHFSETCRKPFLMCRHPFICLQSLHLVIACVVGLVGAAHAQVPAFPGAEGFGAYATGGRGGDVYYVNNLNNSGAGSFADAIATVPAQGRTIVFGVSGYIHVNKTRLAKSKVTIAGQTAPGDGIGFKDGSFIIDGDDIIIRHARYRYRDQAAGGDCINIENGVTDLMLDHLSIQFSTDENLSSFDQDPRPDDMTLQWSLNAWGLESHSAGGLWDVEKVTTHHTLWSHNHTRNPKARPYGLLDWINNVTFDWDIGFIMGDSTTPADWKSNVRGSYFICPPGNLRSVALEKARIDRNGNHNFTLHVDDNLFDKNGNGLLDGSDFGYGIASGSYVVSNNPIVLGSPLPVAIDPPLTAYKKIVSSAGALRLDAGSSIAIRDEVDGILMNNLVTRTPNHVSNESQTGASNGGMGALNSIAAPSDSDLDGMPDYWELSLGSNVSGDDHNNPVPAGAYVPNIPAGYTLLEEYLHFRAIPHAVLPKSTVEAPSSLTTDLRRFASGFNTAPVVFTLSNVINGSATLQPDGYTVIFEPPANFSGRSRFDFTVTDGDGSTWTQTLAVLVSSVGLPHDLKWKGDGGANLWNTNDLNFLDGTTAATFSIGDNVVFDDSGLNAPDINIISVLAPGLVDVSAAQDYTFSGSGNLAGGMVLTKSGAGVLTVRNPNSYVGGTVIDEGTLVIGGGGNIGSGGVTFQGGALTSAYGPVSTLNLGGMMTVPSGETGTLNLSPRVTLNGLSGGGTLNLNVSGTVFNYDRLAGSHSGFNGALNITGTVPGAVLSLYFNGGAFDGNLGNATVHLDNVTILGRHNSTGNTLTLGALTGTASAALGGSGYAGNETITVGGLGLNTTYGGSIANGVSTTLINKVGSGTLILTGNNSHTGNTTVSGGTLRISGNNGPSPVVAASGGNVAGTGTIGGMLTGQTGSRISPGNTPGEAGTLNVAGGVDLAGTTLLFDLSSNPASGNDRILMSGGTLIYRTPPAFFQFNLMDGLLGAGTYTLIWGGTGTSAPGSPSLQHNLPTGGRQTFALQRSGGGSADAFARLIVSGSPGSVVWQGTSGANWDLTTLNWLNGASADRYFNFDNVRLDDTAAVSSLNLAGTLVPLSVTVSNSALNYAFSGGTLGGPMKLAKQGTGTLTLSTPHSFTGGSEISGGIVVMLSDHLLGSGDIVLSGGGLAVLGGNLTNHVSVSGSGTVYGSGAVHSTLAGLITGNGNLSISAPSSRIVTQESDLSGFSGTLILTGTGSYRLNQAGTVWGNTQCTFDLGSSGTLNNRATTYPVTVELGALTGGAGSRLMASEKSEGSGLTDTYFVGHLNLDSTFNGTIQNGPTHDLALTKTGSGTLTLTAGSSYSGGTVVGEGALRVNNATGSGTGGGEVIVETGATLGGVGAIGGPATLAEGAALEPGASPGTLTFNSDLILNELTDLYFELGTNSDSVVVDGILFAAGGLHISDAGGFGPGTHPLFFWNTNETMTLGMLSVETAPPGYNYSVSTNAPGRIDLVVTTPAPVFGQIGTSGDDLILSGSGGPPGGDYLVLTATNLALPLVQWLPVSTNQYDTSGNFSITNPIEPGVREQFYRLEQP